jgi:hypothetical protein
VKKKEEEEKEEEEKEEKEEEEKEKKKKEEEKEGGEILSSAKDKYDDLEKSSVLAQLCMYLLVSWDLGYLWCVCGGGLMGN